MKAAELIMPVAVFALIVYALIRRVNVYKAFVEGAAEALPRLLSILPYLAAMLAAIEIFRGSGALDAVVKLVGPALESVGLPAGTAPLILLRPFSGSASLVLLKDILTEHGPDSPAGRTASVILGSTETVFYTVSVYFGSVGVTRTRHSIPAALISGIVGTAAGALLTSVF
ncbi:MAG: spore maturation protein [Clostridia bacterium]|nr:spore maturation protein [Clostridia bacterium]